MKILMISSFLPFPLTSGGHIRLFNLIKNLSEKHQITLVCEIRDSQTKDDLSQVEKICEKVITVRRKRQWSVGNIAKTGFSFDPFLITGHKSEEMMLKIQDELVREPYDIIHVETFYVYQNLPKTKLPVVLVEHNIEYLVYQRYADLANPLIRPFLYVDILKLKNVEEKTWHLATKLVSVSNVEKRFMKMPEVSVVPNGVDTYNFRFRELSSLPKEKRILFIGDYKWMQNRDAVMYIIGEVWPSLKDKLKETGEDVKLWIVGKHMPQSFKRFEAEDIIIDANNKDETTEIFKKAYILLAPLRAAGGTSYKILESFAAGVAVVTTGLGIEGLEAKNGVNVLSSDNPVEMAGLVHSLVTDHSLYKKITINARKFVEENYDWKIISQKLEEVYESCV